MNHGKENFGAPQCLHFKFNDEQCRQPALQHKKYCRFHNFAHEENIGASDGRLRIPLAEDTPSIQIGINQIMRAIVSNTIDHKTAWLLLYSLQLSTSNLAKQRDVFPPPPPEEEQEEEENNGHKSLLEILVERLSEHPPAPVPADEPLPVFHQPPPSFPGYPKMPVPDGFRREAAKPEQPANAPPNTTPNTPPNT